MPRPNERTAFDKVCSGCAKFLPLTEFYARKNTKSGVGSHCRKCKNQLNNARAKKRRAEVAELLQELREAAGNRCAECGGTGGLEFAHTDPRQRRFAVNSRSANRSDSDIRAEALKCRVLCRACHLTETKRQWASGQIRSLDPARARRREVERKSRGIRYAYIQSHKKICADCGAGPEAALEFDHVRGVKKANLAVLVCRSIPIIDAEISKCEVVCHDCHRKRTAARRTSTSLRLPSAPDLGEVDTLSADAQNDAYTESDPGGHTQGHGPSGKRRQEKLERPPDRRTDLCGD